MEILISHLEIEIVWESKPTEDQIEKALRLKLSPSFYLYENTLPCPGCRGCIDDIPVIGKLLFFV